MRQLLLFSAVFVLASCTHVQPQQPNPVPANSALPSSEQVSGAPAQPEVLWDDIKLGDMRVFAFDEDNPDGIEYKKTEEGLGGTPDDPYPTFWSFNFTGDYLIQVPLGWPVRDLQKPRLVLQILEKGKLVHTETLQIQTDNVPSYAHFLLRNGDFTICEDFTIKIELIAGAFRDARIRGLQSGCGE